MWRARHARGLGHPFFNARRLAFLSIAVALLLAACVPANAPTSGYGGSTSPPGYISNPYHYRCTGNCQAGS